MDAIGGQTYLQLGAALLLVIGLIGLLGFILRRTGLGLRLPQARGRQRRLSVIEALPLDNRRRLLLIRRDGQEHLLLLGHQQDLVIEAGIQPPASPATPPSRGDARDRGAEPTLSAPAPSPAAETKL